MLVLAVIEGRGFGEVDERSADVVVRNPWGFVVVVSLVLGDFCERCCDERRLCPAEILRRRKSARV
jgi:hypothetical protein